MGAPVKRPGREERVEGVEGVEALVESTLDVRDQVHEVRVALDVGQSIDAHGARLGDATDVVATEVDEHDVLGDLLLVVQQFVFEFQVLGLVHAARPRAGDRPVAHQPVVHAHQHLGRRADDLDLARVQAGTCRARG